MEPFNAGLCALYGPLTVHMLHHSAIYYVREFIQGCCKFESPVVSSCSTQRLARGRKLGKGR
jgi:hypothetical protein